MKTWCSSLLVALLAAVAHHGPARAAEGQLDPGFASGVGAIYASFAPPGASSGQTLSAITFDAQGRILAVGYLLRPGGAGYDCVVMRFGANATGGIDQSFAAPNGYRLLSLDLGGNNFDICNSIQILPDGRIAVGGYSEANGATTTVVYLLDANGTPDMSFFGNGVFDTRSDISVFNQFNLNSTSVDSRIDAQGRLVLMGRIDNANGQEGMLLRFATDGTLDDGFGSGGLVRFADFNPPRLIMQSIAIEADGHILVAGLTTNYQPPNASGVIFRFNDDGTVDTNFGVGMTGLGGGGRGFLPNYRDLPRLRVDANGRLLLPATRNDGRLGVLRLLANGQSDLAFGSGGFLELLPANSLGHIDALRDLADLPDGQILVMARWINDAIPQADAFGELDTLLARVRADGQGLDTSFGYQSGITRFRFTDPTGAIADTRSEFPTRLYLDPQGRAYVMGRRDPASGSGDNNDMFLARVVAVTPQQVFANGFE